MFGYSGGSESTACVSLGFDAALQAKALGVPLHPLIIKHADTLIENPEVQALIMEYLGTMRIVSSDGYRLCYRPEIREWTDGDLAYGTDADGYPVTEGGDRLDGVFEYIENINGGTATG